MSRRRPAPPPELPGFRHVELLGSGGFADVHKYVQLGLERPVAVKVLLSGMGEADQASFQAEANVMAQLSNHPSIVSIYQAHVTDDGRAYLVMEFCPPPHLGQRIRARRLSPAKALEVTIQLAGAVETAHRLGILHRDIKPANILFTEFGRPALTDFGISVATHSAQSGQGVGMSVPWAPPEQLTVGAPMGVTGDVYSLAATLWTALVGRPPFHVPGGDNEPVAMAARVRTQPLAPTGREDVPESLERVLRVAMAKDPGQRYDSVLELARALQGVQAELHQPVTAIDVRDDTLDGLDTDDEPEGGTRFTGFVSVDPDGPGTTPGTSPNTSTNTSPGTSPDPVEDHTSARVGDTRPRSDGPLTPPPAGPRTDHTAGHSGGHTGGHIGGDTGWSDDADQTGRTVGRARARGPARPAAPGDQGHQSDTTDTPAERPGRSRTRLLVVAGAAVALVVAGVAWQAAGDDPGTRPPETQPQLPPDEPMDPVSEVVPAPTDLIVRLVDGDRLRVSWSNPDPLDGDSYAYRLLDPVEPQEWRSTGRTRTTVRAAPGRQCVQVTLVRETGRSSNRPAEACPGDTP